MTRSPRRGRYSRLLQHADQAVGKHPMFHAMRRAVHDLWPRNDQGVSALQEILKSVNDAADSRQAGDTGELRAPFDFDAATRFKVHNVHHSTCIEARKQAMVGLGHTRPEGQSRSRAAETLDPLSRVSWQTTLTQCAEDYVNVGNAYLEVIRKAGARSPITGIHYVPASTVRIVLEDSRGVDRHFRVLGAGDGGGADLPMAVYGDLADFTRRVSSRPGIISRVEAPEDGFSEIIHIPQPATGLDRWYGFPDWLAATGYVELTQAVLQAQFDFFSNRGVPEFLLFLLGGRVDDGTWNNITRTFDSYVGFGQQHKSSVFNLPDGDLKVQVERLALEGIANGTFFRDMMEVLSTTIVSAHRVPPTIAGILIPGKMGAANEVMNAIMAFQTLSVGPAQHHFQTILGCTLGNDQYNGNLGLTHDDFELNTIVGAMHGSMQQLQPMDTMSRMRDSLPEAQARGRSMSDGLLENGQQRAERAGAEPVSRSMQVEEVLKNEGLMASLFALAAERQAERGRNGSVS